MTSRRICSSTRRIPGSLKMCIRALDGAKPDLSNRKATLPKTSEELGNNDRFSHLCLLVITADRHICAHVSTQRWQCLHDVSFSWSVTVICQLIWRWCSRSKNMKVLKSNRGQNTGRPRWSLIRQITCLRQYPCSSFPKYNPKTLGTCTSSMRSSLTTPQAGNKLCLLAGFFGSCFSTA